MEFDSGWWLGGIQYNRAIKFTYNLYPSLSALRKRRLSSSPSSTPLDSFLTRPEKRGPLSASSTREHLRVLSFTTTFHGRSLDDSFSTPTLTFVHSPFSPNFPYLHSLSFPFLFLLFISLKRIFPKSGKSTISRAVSNRARCSEGWKKERG